LWLEFITPAIATDFVREKTSGKEAV